MNLLNHKGERKHHRLLLVLFLFIVMCITSCVLGYIMGLRARSSGELIDTIVLDPNQSSDIEEESNLLSFSGVIRDKDGIPYANGTVELHSTPRTTTTDENGYFFFYGVEQGEHNLSVLSSDGAVLAEVKLNLVSSSDSSVSTMQEDENHVWQMAVPLDALVVEFDLDLNGEDGTLTPNPKTLTTVCSDGKVIDADGTIHQVENEDYTTPSGAVVHKDGTVELPNKGTISAEDKYIPPETTQQSSSPEVTIQPSDTSDNNNQDTQTTPDEIHDGDDVEKPAEGAVQITENGVDWTQLSYIDLFAGNKVLYPGISGNYNFRISNTQSFDVHFRMTIAEMEHPAGKIPLEYRLKSNEGYVTGSEWKTAENLEQVWTSVTAGNSIPYTLEWRWNSDDDARDTALGTNENRTHIITITIYTEQIA